MEVKGKEEEMGMEAEDWRGEAAAMAKVVAKERGAVKERGAGLVA